MMEQSQRMNIVELTLKSLNRVNSISYLQNLVGFLYVFYAVLQLLQNFWDVAKNKRVFLTFKGMLKDSLIFMFIHLLYLKERARVDLQSTTIRFIARKIFNPILLDL